MNVRIIFKINNHNIQNNLEYEYLDLNNNGSNLFKNNHCNDSKKLLNRNSSKLLHANYICHNIVKNSSDVLSTANSINIEENNIDNNLHLEMNYLKKNETLVENDG